MDFSRFIQGPIYDSLVWIIEALWSLNRYLMLGTLLVDQFNQWVIDNAGDIIELVALSLQGPAGLALMVAFTLYGLWKVAATLMPDMPWRPVELPKIIIYGIAMSMFFAAPAAGMVAVDTMRTTIATGLTGDVFTTVTAELVPDGFDSSEPPIPLSPLVTSTGAVGARLAASYMLVNDVDEFGSEAPSQLFQDQFIPNDSYEFENLNPDDRKDAMGVAFAGIIVQLSTPLLIFYAFFEVLLWTILSVGVMVLWIGLPIALMFSPFTASEGIFKTFVARYIGIMIETIVSAVIMGISTSLLISSARYGVGLMFGTVFLTMCIVLWRIMSAVKTASTAASAIDNATASLSGGMSASDGAKAIGSGTVAVAGAALTGGASLAMGLNTKALNRMGAEQQEKYQGQYDNAQSQLRRWAGAGGYVMGHNNTAANLMGKAQQARLISGSHSPAEGMDSMDAAYLGSRMSSGGPGSAAYMTTSMMGGPGNAFEAMGYKTFSPTSKMGMQGNGGVDEAGNAVDEAQGGKNPRYADDKRGRRNGSSSNKNREEGSNQWSDIPNDNRTSTNLKNGKDRPSSAEKKPDPVELYPGTKEATDAWIDQVAETQSSATRRSNLVGSAQKQFHKDADKVADMVDTHGAENVKDASKSVREAVSGYKKAGLNNDQIMAKFQSGDAQKVIQGNAVEGGDENLVISDTDSLDQIAAFTLRPVTVHSGGKIVSALGSAVDKPEINTPSAMEGYAMHKLGSDGQFGGYTATARSIVGISREMGVSGNQLNNAFQAYQSGDIQGARNELAAAPNSNSAGINKMMTNFKTIPQTARLSTDIRAQSQREGPPLSNPSLQEDPTMEEPEWNVELPEPPPAGLES